MQGDVQNAVANVPVENVIVEEEFDQVTFTIALSKNLPQQ